MSASKSLLKPLLAALVGVGMLVASLTLVSVQILEARRTSVDQRELLGVVVGGMGAGLALALLCASLWVAARETARRRERLAREAGLRAEAEQARFRAGESEAEAVLDRQRAESAYEDRERFLAGAAHDLRQPLHFVRLALSAMEDTDPDKRGALLQQVRQALHALERTLEQLIDARRLTMQAWLPALEEVAVANLFAAMQDTYGPIAVRAGLRFRCRGRGVLVRTDRGMTERILSNLLLNAIKYTERGGILLAARRRQDRVVIQVWDSGVGIARHEFELLFREFSQAGAHGKEGFGLGLFISGELARALGTELSVESRLGSGSCFSFSLPIAHARTVRAISQAERAV